MYDLHACISCPYIVNECDVYCDSLNTRKHVTRETICIPRIAITPCMFLLLYRTMFLPYKLTPHLISFTGFKKGSTAFSASIHIATGHKGTRKAKHSTLTSAVDKFAGLNVQMQCIVLYSNAFYKPWSKLCVKSIFFEEMKRQLS